MGKSGRSDDEQSKLEPTAFSAQQRDDESFPLREPPAHLKAAFEKLQQFGPAMGGPALFAHLHAVSGAIKQTFPGDEPGSRNWQRVTAVSSLLESKFMQEAAKLDLSKAQKIAVLRYLIALLEPPAESKLPPSLPTKAPRLWIKRDRKNKTNPSKFTRLVYGGWLGKGLTRKHLRDLDEPLYHALSVWEHRHPEDTIQELPTLAQVIDQKIEKLSTEFTAEELRKLGTTLQTRLRRTKK